MVNQNTVDILSDHCRDQRDKIRLLERLLGVCVARLGGTVVVTSDNEDVYVEYQKVATGTWELTTRSC